MYFVLYRIYKNDDEAFKNTNATINVDNDASYDFHAAVNFFESELDAYKFAVFNYNKIEASNEEESNFHEKWKDIFTGKWYRLEPLIEFSIDEYKQFFKELSGLYSPEYVNVTVGKCK